MNMFPRPRIVISRCINFEPVRYNGGIVKDEFAELLGKFVEFVPVCPEVEIGLGVPREPISLKRDENGVVKVFRPGTGEDFTEKMENFSKGFIGDLKDVDGFLLKAKSPSCGVKDTLLYDSLGKRVISKTNGIFAQIAMSFYPWMPIEDEGRLRDFWIRYHFLTRIFAFADLRENFNGKDRISDLLAFHRRYKYLLMLYSPSKLRELGQLLANWDKLGLLEVKRKYIDIFRDAMKKKPNPRAHVNVIQHVVGHFSEFLGKGEKIHIQGLLRKFVEGRISLSVLLEILRNFALRFEDEYLITQAYLRPFPDELEF
ncbi:MAG: DUF523 and DUF1722 domain-containing protein [candidate division WOR-3 bacterium]